jgi:hypothetical protein
MMNVTFDELINSFPFTVTAAYCRHSSYKLPCKVSMAAKKAMFKECGLTAVKVLGFKDFKNGCCQIRQRVASQVRGCPSVCIHALVLSLRKHFLHDY